VWLSGLCLCFGYAQLDMVPAMILRMRIILCDELQDRGDFDLTAYMSDTLHEAV
jgi:hypothetical protein